MATTEPQSTASEPTTPPTMAPMLLLLPFESPFGSSGPEADGAALVDEEDAVEVAVSEAIFEVDAGAPVVEVLVP